MKTRLLSFLTGVSFFTMIGGVLSALLFGGQILITKILLASALVATFLAAKLFVNIRKQEFAASRTHET